MLDALTPREAALFYAQRGWRVFPCGDVKGRTQPLIRAWQEKASTHPGRIEQWWQTWPDAIVSIATGPGSDLLVIDLDEKKGQHGIAEWERLSPDADFAGPIVRTASGGLHMYYRYEADDIHNTASRLAPGVDVRCWHGFVYAPPSGGRTWLQLPDVLPEVPPWLHDKLTNLQTENADGSISVGGRSQLTDLLDNAPAHEGDGRNDWLTRVAGHYAKLYRGQRDTFEWHVAQANELILEPLPEDEVRRTVNSVWEMEQRKPSTGYGRGSGITLLAEDAAGDSPIKLGHDGKLYRYVDGVYKADGDLYLRSRTRLLLGDQFKRSMVDEVLAFHKAQLPTVGDRPPTDIVNCYNGLLEWRTGVLRPHTPDVVTTAQIPVAWDPDATAPRWSQFLDEVLADSVDMAMEIAGYGLYPDNPFHVAVLCLGGGRNGKSTFLQTVQSMYGIDNCSSITLQAFSENRFSAANLHGMLANVCGDLDARAIKRTDAFKMLTGNDVITAEHKNLPQFQFRSYALPLFSANEAPITSDQTAAWFDRWLILPFNARFVGKKQDVMLPGKLLAELPGVLNMAVAGLRRLIDRGQFEKSKPAEEAGTEYRERLDTSLAFLTEFVTVENEAWTPRSELYRNYKEWAKDQGRWPVSSMQFNDRVRVHFPDIEERQVKRGGVNHGQCWLGLRVGVL